MTAAMPTIYSNRPRIQEVAQGIFRIDLCVPEILGPTNSYIFKADGIHDTGRSLIVDTGCSHPETKTLFNNALLELEIAWDNVDVFITHFHWDHCVGLSQIWQPGMTIYGGLANYDKRPTPIMGGAEIGRIEREITARHGISDVYDEQYWKPMTDMGWGTYPIKVVFEGDEIQVGKYCLKVLETPGHEVNHRSLYDEKAGIFAGGDQVLQSLYPTIFLEEDIDQVALFMQTMKRLSSLEAKTVLCGHGAEGNDLAKRCKETLAYTQYKMDEFLSSCKPGLYDAGEISYLYTQQPKRAPWEARSIFSRRALLAQNMAYLKHFVATGILPDKYTITLLK